MASYVIEMQLSRPSEITIGALGCIRFQAGRYLYVGSAKRGWDARIARHMAPEKKLRWHVDYLTTHPQVVLQRAWMSEQDQECVTAQQLLLLPGVEVALPRMGASDCQCAAHCMRATHILSVRHRLKTLHYQLWQPPTKRSS